MGAELGRPAGAALGRADRRFRASRPPGAAGHGHERQGRRAAPHDRPRRPAGRPDHQLQGAHRGGEAARLPLADREGPAAGRLHRRLRPLALRGRADRPGAELRRPRRDRAALRRHQRLRGPARRRGVHDHQVHAPHQRRRAEGPARRSGSTTPRSTGSTTPATSTSARCGRPTATPTRSRSSAPTPRSRRGTWSRPTRSGSATSPSASCCSTPCAASTCSGRSPTSTSSRRDGAPGRGDAGPVSPHRSSHRHRHALRHPAARGRQPARSRRGRRPRHLRLQVPRRRARAPRSSSPR